MLTAIVLFCLFSPLVIARYHTHDSHTHNADEETIVIWGDFDEDNEIRNRYVMPEFKKRIELGVENLGCYDLFGNPTFPEGMRITTYDNWKDNISVKNHRDVDGEVIIVRGDPDGRGYVIIESTCPLPFEINQDH